MRFKKIAAMVVGLMVLAGCTQIEDGNIYLKELIPSHQVEVDDSFTLDVGDIPITIPQSHYETVPDEFFVSIRKLEEGSDRYLTRRVQVTEDTYNRYKEGDYISFKDQ